MKTNREFLRVAAFLRRHAPGLRAWDHHRLLGWLGWYWDDARVGVITADRRIVAVALARGLDRVEQAADPYFHHEQGRILWVQDIVSLHPRGIEALLGTALQRFGPRETLAGRVFHREGELRMLPWHFVARLTKGGLPHGLTHHRSAGSA